MRSGRRVHLEVARARSRTGWVRLSLILGFALLLPFAGCRSGPVVPARAAGHREASAADREGLLKRSNAARRQARHAEKSDLTNCVDDYYRAAVFAYAAVAIPGGGGHAGCLATDLYNENLADCLRTAQAYGRIDPRSRMLIHAPGGPISVEVAHHGFPWKTEDFHEIVDSRTAPQKTIDLHPEKGLREGLGSSQVVIRRNPEATPSDKFMAKRSYFPATAVLRPDLGAWLGTGGTGLGHDVLEFHDPLRVHSIEVAGRRTPIAADIEAANDLAEKAVDSRRFTLTGFVNPSQEIENARFGFIEPYQPGKIVVVFIHGLLDNPYTFKEIVNRLRERPGFVDRYQLAFFRYPTGSSFLRSASILRTQLRQAEATFDPSHSDPGFQNMVLVGYSMGGLLTKLQITSSGGEVWSLFSDRPLDSLVMSEQTRAAVRGYAFFEPIPFVRRAVFLATPHNGSGYATNIVGQIATRMVRRPEDAVAMVDEVERSNPGVIKPFVADLPTSIDLLAVRNPLLDVMNRLPINPSTTYHVIAGTSYVPPQVARGDGIVPLSSARIEGSASEHLVRAVHTNITRSPEAIREIDRILREHAASLSPTGR